MTTLIDQRTLTARKEHQCSECLGTIGAGDRYERARLVDGRDAWTWKSHHLCHSVAIDIARDLDLLPDEWPDDHDVRIELRRIFGALAQLAVVA